MILPVSLQVEHCCPSGTWHLDVILTADSASSSGTLAHSTDPNKNISKICIIMSKKKLFFEYGVLNIK